MRIAAWMLPLMLGAVLRVAAQAATDPAVARILQRANTEAMRTRGSLPNISCHFDALSWAEHKGKTHRRTEFSGEARVVRQGDLLSESWDVATVNGKAAAPGKLHAPYGLQGVLMNPALALISGQQACFRYSLTGEHLTFASVPGSDRVSCAGALGVSGVAAVDASGDLIHVEAEQTAEAAKEGKHLPYTSAVAEQAAVMLGGEEFRLATRAHYANRVDKDTALFFDLTYSSCKLFTSTIRIVPGSVVDEDGDASGPHAVPSNK